MRKIRARETVHPRELITIVGERIWIPDQGQFVHGLRSGKPFRLEG
jgi:hypothetical protein